MATLGEARLSDPRLAGAERELAVNVGTRGAFRGVDWRHR
jgi:hypothetical protein